MINRRNKYHLRIIVLLICLVPLIGSCTMAGEIAIPTTSLIASTPTIQVLASSTLTPTQTMLMETWTPTLLPEAKCPVLNNLQTIPKATTGDEADKFILQYLNLGGSPEQLSTQIKNLGPIVDSFQVFIMDVNGDGIKDIIVAINFNPPESEDWTAMAAGLYEYTCVDGVFQVQKIAGERMEKIEILALDNFLGSKNVDVLVKEGLYSDGYSEILDLYSLSGQNWFSSFETDEFPGSLKVELDNANGNRQLVIEGIRYCGSMLCNHWRKRRVTYEFHEGKVDLVKDELLPSPYRFHALEDGQIAVENGNLEEAVSIYNKAATDDGLVDVPTFYELELQANQKLPVEKLQRTAHAYQTASAAFREYCLLIYLGRIKDADAVLTRMKATYPEGTEGSEFLDLASYLTEQLKSGLNYHDACEATNTYLADKYILGTDNFVYNHLLGWDDISKQPGELLCPVLK
jgi:hypothetical protein